MPRCVCNAGLARRMRLSRVSSAMMLPGAFQSRARISYFSECRYSSRPGRVRHQRDVRASERQIKVVADQDALAADRVFWPELFAQRRIGYLRLQVRAPPL